MSKRSQEDLKNHPCMFKLKDIDNPPTRPTNGEMKTVRRVVPKLDEGGNQVYKDVVVNVKKKCGCRNKDGSPQTEQITQRVPETIEVEERVLAQQEQGKKVICKLYGMVQCHYCENCHTYKPK